MIEPGSVKALSVRIHVCAEMTDTPSLSGNLLRLGIGIHTFGFSQVPCPADRDKGISTPAEKRPSLKEALQEKKELVSGSKAAAPAARKKTEPGLE